MRSTYLYDGLGNVVRIKADIEGGPGVFPPSPAPPAEADICDTAKWTDAGSTYYCYDEFSRLIYTQAPGGDAAETDVVQYDGLDRREMKLTGNTADRFDELSYVGTSQLLSREERKTSDVATYDYDSEGVRRGQSYTPGSGSGVEGGYRSYTTDANGSVAGLEDAAGLIDKTTTDGDKREDYRYDPYGELVDPDPSDAQEAEEHLNARAQENPFRFEGFYYDSAVKTYDMLARAYRPETARFLSEDRYADAGLDIALQSDPLTQNRYVFAGGNPVSNVEWDGHCFGKKGGFISVLCRRATNAIFGREVARAGREAFRQTALGQAVSSMVATANAAISAPPPTVHPLIRALPADVRGTARNAAGNVSGSASRQLNTRLDSTANAYLSGEISGPEALDAVAASLARYAEVELPNTQGAINLARAMRVDAYRVLVDPRSSPAARVTALAAREVLSENVRSLIGRGTALALARSIGARSLPILGVGIDYFSERKAGADPARAAYHAAAAGAGGSGGFAVSRQACRAAPHTGIKVGCTVIAVLVGGGGAGEIADATADDLAAAGESLAPAGQPIPIGETLGQLFGG